MDVFSSESLREQDTLREAMQQARREQLTQKYLEYARMQQAEASYSSDSADGETEIDSVFTRESVRCSMGADKNGRPYTIGTSVFQTIYTPVAGLGRIIEP